jgi:hypothetical protein
MTNDRDARLAAALAAAERGWPVFPLRCNDKRPRYPDHTADRCNRRDPRCHDAHQGFEPRATTDTDRIRRGWTHAFNVGIATGPAGLIVVDLDVPKPGEETPPAEWRIDGVTTGEDVLAVLADRAGASLGELYDTYTVITGRGGRHLYFTAPEGARLGNTGAKLGWLIDTRAHGGYVVAAGSVASGRPYAVAHDTPARPFPAWLFQRLSSPVVAPRVPLTIGLMTGRYGAYLTAALTREVAHVTSAPPTTRNHALFMAAQNLGQLVAGGSLGGDEVTALLEQAAAVHVAAGAFTAREAANTIASGLRAGARRPRTVAA